jgi:hypothetical protein
MIIKNAAIFLTYRHQQYQHGRHANLRSGNNISAVFSMGSLIFSGHKYKNDRTFIKAFLG